ncbi:MAG: shikimate dehydrogenase [Coprobacter sp.]|nr:shikimate dehydrogenase [Coprobacter sp.]
MCETTNEREIYGLTGYPLGHSFSRRFFNERFAAEGRNAEYVNFEIEDIARLPEIVASERGLRGMNVTIPYKEAVIPYLDELDETARRIGAVNVIRFIREGERLRLKGYNSDIVGFTGSIRPLLRPGHRRALILGTGGASKAVRLGLEMLGIVPVFVSRTPRPGQLSYGELTAEVLAGHTVIVNSSPVGMHPHPEVCPDIPYGFLSPDHLLYDLIYNPEETLFMRRGREMGAVVKNGLEMLQRQALAAWDIWQLDNNDL